MCLLAFSWQPSDDHPLLLIANRDEQHARPTAALGPWPDRPDVLAGRDLQQGGTWLGIQARGVFAALTNYRRPPPMPDKNSRGHLVAQFLLGTQSPLAYAEQVAQNRDDYDGFNLLLGDRHELVYFSNRSEEAPRILEPGVYGLSNALLDSPWPKLTDLRDGLADRVAAGKTDSADLLPLLQQKTPYPDEQLPDTGVGAVLERMLSPAFIQTPVYGTRCSTWLRWGSAGADIHERSFDPAGRIVGERCEQLLWI